MKHVLVALLLAAGCSGADSPRPPPEPGCRVEVRHPGHPYQIPAYYICDGAVVADCWMEQQSGEYFVVEQDGQTFYCVGR